MPSQQEVRWSQLKVGIIILGSSVLLLILLFLITSSNGISIFSRRIIVYSYFENSAGLKQGAPVDLEGVTVGTVKSVSVVADPNRRLTPVRIVMQMDERYTDRVRKDSRVSLSTVGVLGDTVLDINSQVATGAPIQTGDELKTTETPNLQDVIKASQGTVESLNVILAKLNTIIDNIQSGKGSIGMLINNPDLYNKANATLDEFHTLSAKLNSNNNTVGKFMNDNAEMYGQIHDILAKVDGIAADLQNGKGSAGILLKDPTLARNLNTSLSHLNSILTQVDDGKGSVGILMKDPAFAQNLNSTVNNLNDLLGKINSGQGTIGKLANDDSVYTNLNKLLSSSTDLVTTIRSNPKKYLTIHLKIF